MSTAIMGGTEEGWDHKGTSIGKYHGFHTSYNARNKEIDELKDGGIQMLYDSVGTSTPNKISSRVHMRIGRGTKASYGCCNLFLEQAIELIYGHVSNSKLMLFRILGCTGWY